MEDLPILKQVFNLLIWLQLHSKLTTSLSMDGKTDIFKIEVNAGEKTILEFQLDAFSKKREERINIELKLIIAQLIELKKDEHFQE